MHHDDPACMQGPWFPSSTLDQTWIAINAYSLSEYMSEQLRAVIVRILCLVSRGCFAVLCCSETSDLSAAAELVVLELHVLLLWSNRLQLARTKRPLAVEIHIGQLRTDQLHTDNRFRTHYYSNRY